MWRRLGRSPASRRLLAAAVLTSALAAWGTVAYWPYLFGRSADWAAGGNVLIWVLGGAAGFGWSHLQAERRHREHMEANDRHHAAQMAELRVRLRELGLENDADET